MDSPYYKDGHITIYNTDAIAFLRSMCQASVDAVITDIPYGEVNRSDNGLRNLDKGIADVVDFDVSELAHLVASITKGSAYVFCGIEQVSDIRASFVDEGMSTRLCVWEKTNPSPMNGEHIWLSSVECCVFGKKPGATFNEFCASPVWRYPSGSSKVHPTEKPLALMRRIVSASTNIGDTILDPFCGSGTTARAAKDYGRMCVCSEISSEYCELAARRCSQEVLF